MAPWLHAELKEHAEDYGRMTYAANVKKYIQAYTTPTPGPPPVPSRSKGFLWKGIPLLV